jgi:hypothetical protein
MIKALPVWKWAKAELTSRMGDKKLRSAQRAMAELAEAAEASSSAPPEPVMVGPGGLEPPTKRL